MATIAMTTFGTGMALGWWNKLAQYVKEHPLKRIVYDQKGLKSVQRSKVLGNIKNVEGVDPGAQAVTSKVNELTKEGNVVQAAHWVDGDDSHRGGVAIRLVDADVARGLTEMKAKLKANGQLEALRKKDPSSKPTFTIKVHFTSYLPF